MASKKKQNRQNISHRLPFEESSDSSSEDRAQTRTPVRSSESSSEDRAQKRTPAPKGKKAQQSNKSPQPSTSGLGRSSAQKRKHPSSNDDADRTQTKENKSKVAPKKRKKITRKEVKFGSKYFRVTEKVLAEIAKFQNSTAFLIPKLSFARVVREVLQDVGFRRDWRIQYEALQALQTASEMYLVDLFEDCCLLTMHARRITCNCRDIQLALKLRKER